MLSVETGCLIIGRSRGIEQDYCGVIRRPYSMAENRSKSHSPYERATEKKLSEFTAVEITRND